MLFFIHWLKVDLQLLLPFVLDVLNLATVVKFLKFWLGHLLQLGEFLLLLRKSCLKLFQLIVEALMTFFDLRNLKIAGLQVR